MNLYALIRFEDMKSYYVSGSEDCLERLRKWERPGRFAKMGNDQDSDLKERSEMRRWRVVR